MAVKNPELAKSAAKRYNMGQFPIPSGVGEFFDKIGMNKQLRKKIKDKVFVKELQSSLRTNNVLALPKIRSVVVNVGLGRAVAQSAKPDDIVKKVSAEITAITGQKPVVTKAKKAIASFKTRIGMPLGVKVTLHGPRMYDFLERAVNVAFPRTRDFRGLDPKNVDEGGNLNVGIKDHTIFPEATADASHTFGFEFTVIVSGSNKERSLKFFKMLGFPLQIKK